MAQSGHSSNTTQCPLLGAKRTYLFALQMSAFDPKRTWAAAFRGEAQLHITAPRFGLKCYAKDIYPYGSAICAALVCARSTLFVAGHREIDMEQILINLVAGGAWWSWRR